MKIVVVVGDPNKNMMSRLTKIFTKCPAYHVGFLHEESNMFYDMWWLRRRRVWPRYQDKTVFMFDAPEVTQEYLEHKLSTDDSEYGVLDYLQFALKPLYHVFGLSTKNAGGMICSEMVNSDVWACGGTTPFDPEQSPPSPCELWAWLKNKVDSNTAS